MKLRILILLFSITYLSVSGQHDWKFGKLVLINNDTIEGFIEIPMVNKSAMANSHKIKFKEYEGEKAIRYDHTDVSKVIFKDFKGALSIFEYVRISEHKRQLFKRFHLGDKTRLYGRKVSHGSVGQDANGFSTSTTFYPTDYNEYYIKRKHEKIATSLVNTGTFSKSFRKSAMKYFSDCPDLVKRLKNRTLRESDVLLIVKEYEECE